MKNRGFYFSIIGVVVAFSSHARIWGEGPTIHSQPALSVLFVCLFFSGDQLMHTNSTP